MVPAKSNGSAVEPADRHPTTELVLEAQRGSRTAREELLVRSLPSLRKWARQRLPPSSRGHMDTCDLAQEVALLTVAHLGRFIPEHAGSMAGFLRRVATNRVYDEFRRTVRRPECVELDERIPSGQPGPLDLAVREEERRRYGLALRKLRSKDRRLVVARTRGNCSLATIARRFGLPSVAAAGMAVRRAERRLKQQLAPSSQRC